MKLILENFCSIKKRTEIKPKPLTIFCGKNNTGKTYCLYMLNALMDSRLHANFELTKQHAKALLDTKEVQLPYESIFGAAGIDSAENEIALSLKKSLPQFFAAESDFADQAKIQVKLHGLSGDKFEGLAPLIESMNDPVENMGMLECKTIDDKVSIKISAEWKNLSALERSLNLLLMHVFLPSRTGRNFLLPAERSGLNLFFRELNSQRSALLRHVAASTLDTAAILKDILVARYPRPIHDYIEFMNSQPEIKKQKSEFADLATWLQKEVLKVKYKVDRYGDISIEPAKSGISLGLHMGSSTVKTFFGLWSYLNHLARKGDWLMIDEPELNLHPENQVLIARLLAKMVNRGIQVV